MLPIVSIGEFSQPSPASTSGVPAETTARGSSATIRVAETFVSRQGEGLLTGIESFFIRTSGCNLRCWFCDTPYASWQPEGTAKSAESLVEAAQQSGCTHVVMTGGEPLLPPPMPLLCRMLRAAGLHLTIETAGTVDRELSCDLLSLSPKLKSSGPDAKLHRRWRKLHDARRMPIDIMRLLIARCKASQIKFVVDSPADFDEILEIIDKLQVRRESVWLMPQGVTAEALDQAGVWLRPWCEANSLTYGDRMQIRWYGNLRGT